jgi:hypothetical protein
MEPSMKILAIEDDLGDVELLRRYLGDRPDLRLQLAFRISRAYLRAIKRCQPTDMTRLVRR